MREVTDPAEIWNRLRRRAGTWEGSGHGEFPTLESFDFPDRMIVRSGYGLVQYQQHTWESTGAGDVPSHREAGFMAVTDDGFVAIHGCCG